MIAQLSSLTFDLDGAIILEILDDSDLGTTSRRVTRIATLDGGVAINDFGYSAADKILLLRFQSTSKTEVDRVRRLVELYDRLNLSVDGQFYVVAPNQMLINQGVHELSLLVIQKVSNP
jgi:hypothetical protein